MIVIAGDLAVLTPRPKIFLESGYVNNSTAMDAGGQYGGSHKPSAALAANITSTSEYGPGVLTDRSNC